MAGPGPLTLVDVEVRGLLGPDLGAAAVEAARHASPPMAMPPTRQPINLASDDLAVTWDDLCQRHPEWDGKCWEECRALYAGGQRLLGNKAVFERLFPRHMHESLLWYEARKSRAHYYPYAGTIIDHLLAGLGTDPLTVSFTSVDENGVAHTPSGAAWWEEWVEDVTDEAERPADYGLESDDAEDDDEGGRTMHQFLVDALREALQTRTAWALVDLPTIDESAPIDSQLAVERSGALDPYLCLVPAEQVVDWQCDERGRLTWAMIMTCEAVRDGLRGRRSVIRHTFTIWDATSWVRYVVMVDPKNPPQGSTVHLPVAAGDHGFGRVPLERLELPDGMYAMGKLHSLAREHFNMRCAMSWAANKSLIPILYEYLGPEDKLEMPTAAAQQDPARATSQVRAIGWTQVRGKDDKAEFVGPDPAAFVAARETCNDTMREMHRVMYSMALSADQGAAAAKQSGESKDDDHAVTAVLLDAFGIIARRWCRRLLVLAGLGRREAPPKSTVSGYQHFDVAGTTEAIQEAVTLFGKNGIPILSPLFEELAHARLYEKYLGDITQAEREKIREQIREHQAEREAMAAALPQTAAGKPAKESDGDDGTEPEGDEGPTPKMPAKRQGGPLKPRAAKR